MSGSVYAQIYRLVRQIPPGSVSTYGRVGQQLGCTARTVGFALAALPVGSDVPWQRVVNSRGAVSPRQDGEGNQLQRELLQLEGVRFEANGRIDLSRYLYRFAD